MSGVNHDCDRGSVSGSDKNISRPTSPISVQDGEFLEGELITENDTPENEDILSNDSLEKISRKLVSKISVPGNADTTQLVQTARDTVPNNAFSSSSMLHNTLSQGGSIGNIQDDSIDNILTKFECVVNQSMTSLSTNMGRELGNLNDGIKTIGHEVTRACESIGSMSHELNKGLHEMVNVLHKVTAPPVTESGNSLGNTSVTDRRRVSSASQNVRGLDVETAQATTLPPMVEVSRPLNRNSGYTFDAKVFGLPIKCELDSGSALSLLSKNVYDEIFTSKKPILKAGSTFLTAASGKQVLTLGHAKFTLKIGSDRKVRKFTVVDMQKDCIIGLDLLHGIGNSIFALRRKEADSSGESDTDSDSSGDELSQIVLDKDTKNKGMCRLPPFSAKEKWEVWINRFEEVARRKFWDDSTKLDELLPRLQGEAGEFVFTQLSRKTRSKYGKLIQELDARFKVIEVPKTFQGQFSKRSQKDGESVEAFATDLKKIYNKAYPDRPAAIRQQDLLRRFLDGLLDNDVRLQVEFVKCPSTIDAAVIDVVSYLEVARQTLPGQYRMVRPGEDDFGSDDGFRIGRVPGDKQHPSSKPAIRPTPPAGKSVSFSETNDKAIASNEQYTEIMSALHGMVGRLDKLETAPAGRGRGYSNQSSGSQNGPNVGSGRGKPKTCFSCGKPGHFANSCQEPKRKSCFTCGDPNHLAYNCPNAQAFNTQMQLSVQPMQAWNQSQHGVLQQVKQWPGNSQFGAGNQNASQGGNSGRTGSINQVNNNPGNQSQPPQQPGQALN